ncbi:MAG: SURF1 family protein [Burkholderiales bacterium]|nr:SURF1 family protein [Burkholderiales bacterium]
MSLPDTTGPAPRRRFRPRAVPTIVAALGLTLTVSACVWQYGRGREKDRITETLAAANEAGVVALGAMPVRSESVRFRQVSATGVFIPATLVLQDNQSRGPQPGYHVFMALRIGDGPTHVLVKRGWIAAGFDRTQLPMVTTPDGIIEVSGLALPTNSRFLELSADTQAGSVWQNVTLDRFATRFGIDLQPLILEQHSTLDDGLVRQWPRPASGSATHYGYAFQWGAMATLIVILYVYFALRRPRASAPSAS